MPFLPPLLLITLLLILLYSEDIMHSGFSFSRSTDSYNFDHTSDQAVWVIALVNYWVTHAFEVANCNGFYFNAILLGLLPTGTLRFL